MADAQTINLDNIISRLLEVRGAKPGKNVQLTENEIKGLCFKSMEQIRRIMRPTDVPDQGLLCDLLWSDPDKDVTGWGENDRGVSFTFGPEVVSKFLNQHDLDLICRAHQGAMMSVDETLMCSFQILKPSDKKN
ncbi:hypothetical protein M3Y99_00338300 [Aphelenchoides fujianensis]|nr:hypothetical protein M3Y99_00338300 [Aphelenchoides fujianensis]